MTAVLQSRLAEALVRVPERVNAGVAWFEERCPEWVSFIDVDVLEMRSDTLCVVGQVAVGLGYADGWGWLFTFGEDVYDPEFLVGRGFATPWLPRSAEDIVERALANVWRHVIAEAREAA